MAGYALGRRAALGNGPSHSAASCLTHSALSVCHVKSSAKSPSQSHDGQNKHPAKATWTSRGVGRDVRKRGRLSLVWTIRDG